ncbi:MAG: COQ9 family protein [Alphaproteobacteria bacterium]
MSEARDDHRRTALVLAAAGHVAFDGWSAAAIRAGAREIGMEPAEAMALLPEGERDLIAAFSEWADRRMMEAVAALPLDKMRFRDRIAAAVRARLEALAPYREAVRRGLAVLSLPHMAPLGARLVWRTVDAAWHAVGDSATDFSWYSKRGLLAGVYGATLMCWLTDRSEGHATTWAFLDRRIDDVMRIPKARQRVEAMLRTFPDPRRFFRASRPAADRFTDPTAG